MTHLPTGITEKQEGRNRIDNERNARRALIDRLEAMAKGETDLAASRDRKEQTGSGMRGDKVRTIRFQDDVATDHRTGKRIRASEYMSGGMIRLW